MNVYTYTVERNVEMRERVTFTVEAESEDAAKELAQETLESGELTDWVELRSHIEDDDPVLVKTKKAKC